MASCEIYRALVERREGMGSRNGRKPFETGSLFPLKKGDGVGKTKTGKGAKVMAVVEGDGLPIGLHVDSAQPHGRCTPFLFHASATSQNATERSGGGQSR